MANEERDEQAMAAGEAEAAGKRLRLGRGAFIKGALAGTTMLAASLGQAELTAAHDDDEPGDVGSGGDGTSNEPIKMDWLGWSFYRFATPSGKVILTNPWVTNPDSPVKLEDINQADLIVAPDAHNDEIGQTLEIVQKLGSTKVFIPGELQGWFLEQGLPTGAILQRFAAPGDRLRFEGTTIYMLAAIHGSGLARPTALNPYGGIACSYMFTFENGLSVYFGASSCAMSEMEYWGELYQPHIAIIHAGINHAPADIALQVRLLAKNNRNLTTVFYHHLRATPPANQTNLAEVDDILHAWKLDDITLGVAKVGRTYDLRPGARRKKK